MTKPDERLSVGEILGYSLPAFSLSTIMFSVGIYLPNFYTDELGVSAGMLSWVFLCGRIWDAVTDPTMGHISDRTRTRFGRRRPYFLLSVIPLWLLFFFLWSPSQSLSTTGLFVHLLICYLMLYSFYTVFYIPYTSLGMEMTPDYYERNRLFGVRQAVGLAGLAMGTFAPVFFEKNFGGKVVGYPWMGVVLGGICALFILIMFFRVKEKKEAENIPKYPFLKGVRITFRNRAFVILVLAYMICWIGQSFITPLALYVAKYVVKVEWVTQIVIVTSVAMSVLSIPMWLYFSKKIGKKKTWIAALLFGAVGYLAVFTLREGMWLRWILCTFPIGSSIGCTMVLGQSIAADVIDSDELETGTRREGAFVGIWSFVDKAAIGLAIFAGLQGLELIGYVPNVEQSRIVIIGILFLVGLLPAICNIVSVLIFQFFPITPEVHAEIRIKLDARKSSAEA